MITRRSFLKRLGAIGVLLAAPLPGLSAVARAQSRLEFDFTPDGLRAAIERLFPAGVFHSRKAYEEFEPGGGMLPADWDGRDYVEKWKHKLPFVQRCVHVVYALAYVRDDPLREESLRQALYYAMYQSAELLAEHPANRGAQLVWRREPVFEEFVRGDFESDVETPIAQLYMRLSLRQTGWRERCSVPVEYVGCNEYPALKPEACPTYVINPEDAVV